jgi:hypothetical protein
MPARQDQQGKYDQADQLHDIDRYYFPFCHGFITDRIGIGKDIPDRQGYKFNKEIQYAREFE